MQDPDLPEIDVEALLTESAPRDGQRCMTCTWLDSRPENERKKWIDALGQPKTWPATQVSRAMAKVPRDDDAPKVPTAGSILNHRGGHLKKELDGSSKRQK